MKVGLSMLLKKNMLRYENGGSLLEARQPDGGGDQDGMGPRFYQEACGVCGRTILTGEKTDLYTSPSDGKPVIVCPHCRDAARQAGFQKGEGI